MRKQKYIQLTTTTPVRSSLAEAAGHWKQHQQQQHQQQSSSQQQQQLVNSIFVQPVTVRVATVVQPQKVVAQEASTSGFSGADKFHNINMTPTNTDSPLRRSEYRDGGRNVNVAAANVIGTPLNDDDEERRQARRRTIMQSSSGRESMFEENETLKKCLEIYNGNKLSRENAWSLSLIDTLSTLLDRHHKSLNNFKVAGSSLEASSKVYGLRVDSVHTDVLRMSAGLNAQKFTDRQEQSDDDDAVATGGEGNADPKASAAGVDENGEKLPEKPKQKPKRTRRVVSTITKNKDTLNARLDTVPLQDPVFGKLNTIVGSINSSNRLMNNILLTTESELRLRTTFRFWDANPIAGCDYTVAPPKPATTENAGTESMDCSAPCDRLLNIRRIDDLQLRPLHAGYVISDTPEPLPDTDEAHSLRNSADTQFDDAPPFDGGNCAEGAIDHMSMAFDINAECEPLPSLNDQPAMLAVDYNDFEELTTEERTAITNCRGLRKAPVLLEDLRPVDASSKLEYSYRPLDKISQFWAGPSHWKFKRARPRPSTQGTLKGVNNQRTTARRTNALSKKRSKPLQFDQDFDDLFIKLDKYKPRKANFQKKWDQRKLKLPTDLQLDPEMFNKFKCAPSAVVQFDIDDDDIDPALLAGGDGLHGTALDGNAGGEHFGDHDDIDCGANAAGATGAGGDADGSGIEMRPSLGGDNFMNISSTGLSGAVGVAHDQSDDGGDNAANNTVLEIATSFDGAPSQVTKIIVPFAKRAKVIDMKNLKRCCTQLINKQIKVPIQTLDIPQHPIIRGEEFAAGMASFKEVYDHLPNILSQNMVDSLSPSIAFYSVLHLANDFNLRLIPQEDLEDFKIRQLTD